MARRKNSYRGPTWAQVIGLLMAIATVIAAVKGNGPT
jgi:hypothetical protein